MAEAEHHGKTVPVVIRHDQELLISWRLPSGETLQERRRCVPAAGTAKVDEVAILAECRRRFGHGDSETVDGALWAAEFAIEMVKRDRDGRGV